MPNLQDYEKNDAGFVDDLKASDLHVQKVVRWLKSIGYEAKKAEIKIRDKVENMFAFSDDGDVLIVLNGKDERVEVKQRHLRFNSKETFPYPTVIIDVAHTWERAEKKPFAYILTNENCSGCVVFYGKDHSQWLRVEKWDRFKKRYRTFLEAPIALAKYCDIT